jgi:hypothetical protein
MCAVLFKPKHTKSAKRYLRENSGGDLIHRLQGHSHFAENCPGNRARD